MASALAPCGALPRTDSSGLSSTLLRMLLTVYPGMARTTSLQWFRFDTACCETWPLTFTSLRYRPSFLVYRLRVLVHVSSCFMTRKLRCRHLHPFAQIIVKSDLLFCIIIIVHHHHRHLSYRYATLGVVTPPHCTFINIFPPNTLVICTHPTMHLHRDAVHSESPHILFAESPSSTC